MNTRIEDRTGTPARPAPRTRGNPETRVILAMTEPGSRRNDPLLPGGRLDWRRAFGRTAPVEIEIGSGKGRWLLAAAAERPGHDFVGIELKRAQLLLCATRAEKRGLGNVRLIRADASRVLWEAVPAASVRALHVYYPDPWWKKRHHKRRLVTDHFVADAARALEPGGDLRVATDVGFLFEEMAETIEASGLFAPAPVDPSEFGTPARPITSYQAKFVPLGRAIHGARFVRNKTRAPDTPDPRTRPRLLREAERAAKAAAAASDSNFSRSPE